MKINFVMYDILRTGGNRILLEYANFFFKEGHDVSIYTTLLPEKLKKIYTFDEYRMSYRAKLFSILNSNKNLLFFDIKLPIHRIPQINNLFIRNADATIFSYWPFAFRINNLNSNKGKKIYLIQAYETWNSDVELLHKSYHLNLVNVVVSSQLKTFLNSKFGCKSIVILNGIDFSKFYNENKVYNNDTVTISFIQYDIEFKGSKYILEAIKKIKNKFEKIRVISFGYKKPEDFPNFIEFYEQPDDETIRKLYSLTDIFVCSSTEEGFYLVPAEAMACKSAVITTPVGAVADFSINKETALYVKPFDSDDIYSKLEYLLNNEKLIKKLSEKGYEMVKNKLNWENSFKTLENLIKS
jgi:glycosyltransferase involved in cell wall biosynthesis